MGRIQFLPKKQEGYRKGYRLDNLVEDIHEELSIAPWEFIELRVIRRQNQTDPELCIEYCEPLGDYSGSLYPQSYLSMAEVLRMAKRFYNFKLSNIWLGLGKDGIFLTDNENYWELL